MQRDGRRTARVAALAAMLVVGTQGVAPAGASGIPVTGRDLFFSCKRVDQGTALMTWVDVITRLGFDKANTPFDWTMTSSRSPVGPVSGSGTTDSRGVAHTKVEFRAPAAGKGQVTVYAVDDEGQYGPLARSRIGWDCGLVPKIESVSPRSGLSAGGTRVTLIGPRVGHAQIVFFRGHGISIRILSARRIRFTMPAHPAGPVNLQVWRLGPGHLARPVSWQVPAGRFTYQ